MTADSGGAAGAGARRVVSVAAPLSLVLATAGAVVALTHYTGREVTQRLIAGFVLLGVAAVVAAGCYWHGARNDHERGRWSAFVAFVVAVGVIALVLKGRHYRYGWF